MKAGSGARLAEFIKLDSPLRLGTPRADVRKDHSRPAKLEKNSLKHRVGIEPRTSRTLRVLLDHSAKWTLTGGEMSNEMVVKKWN